ncbi:MAG: hypothetical protein KY476_03875 [Planctomycetes bacterium]|nr:hypothetical protein [Planctomycetota bacterium]
METLKTINGRPCDEYLDGPKAKDVAVGGHGTAGATECTARRLPLR